MPYSLSDNFVACLARRIGERAEHRRFEREKRFMEEWRGGNRMSCALVEGEAARPTEHLRGIEKTLDVYVSGIDRAGPTARCRMATGVYFLRPARARWPISAEIKEREVCRDAESNEPRVIESPVDATDRLETFGETGVAVLRRVDDRTLLYPLRQCMVIETTIGWPPGAESVPARRVMASGIVDTPEQRPRRDDMALRADLCEICERRWAPECHGHPNPAASAATGA